jgi:hypothetical protein
MRCLKCDFFLDDSFNYCPDCGNSVTAQQTARPEQIPDRFLAVIEEYEKLTKTILDEKARKSFIELPEVRILSVNTSPRRLAAADRLLRATSGSAETLNLLAWVNEMYEVAEPSDNSRRRVWITSGGTRYHKIRDCSGLFDGQVKAANKNRDTFKVQFVALHHAVSVLGRTPCQVCRP